MLRNLLNPLRVTITETTGTDRRTYRHRARNMTDALAELRRAAAAGEIAEACYPVGTTAAVRTRLGRILATRTA